MLLDSLSSCPPSPPESMSHYYSCSPSPLPPPLPPIDDDEIFSYLPPPPPPRPYRLVPPTNPHHAATDDDEVVQPPFKQNLPPPPKMHLHSHPYPHLATEQAGPSRPRTPPRRQMAAEQAGPSRPRTPPRRQMQMPPPQGSPFSPEKSVEDILKRYSGESNAGRVAVHLAQFYFFGTRRMSRSTAGNLDPAGMRRIREIILGKFGKKRCTEDKEALWEKCKIAIGQKASEKVIHSWPLLPRCLHPSWNTLTLYYYRTLSFILLLIVLVCCTL